MRDIDSDLSLAVGDYTRRASNRGKHLGDRHRHDWEEECERLADQMARRPTTPKALVHEEELSMGVFRFDGRGWRRLSDEFAFKAVELAGIPRKRLSRGPRLPEQGREDQLFMLIQVKRVGRVFDEQTRMMVIAGV